MLSLMLALVAATTAQPNADVNAFLQELASKRAGIHALQAPFVQEVTTRAGGVEDTLTDSGNLLYTEPRRLVFRIDQKEGKPGMVMLVDHTRLFQYEPENEQVSIYNRAADLQMDVLFSAFESEFSDLEKAYDIELFEPGAENPRAAKGLLLRPKTTEGGERPLFERVRVYLRAEDYLPVKIHIINDAESEVVLTFENFSINKPVDAKQTQIAVPKGTKVVEDETNFRTVEQDIEYLPTAKVLEAPAAEAPAAAPAEKAATEGEPKA